MKNSGIINLMDKKEVKLDPHKTLNRACFEIGNIKMDQCFILELSSRSDNVASELKE